MTQSPVLGRFQLLDKPIASPGKCAVCGSVTRPVVDINFNLDRYGAVYFCTSCIGEAATFLGYVPSIDLERETSVVVNEYLQANKLALITKEQRELLDNCLLNLSTALLPANMEPLDEDIINSNKLNTNNESTNTSEAGEAINESVISPIDERSVSVPSGGGNEQPAFDFEF